MTNAVGARVREDIAVVLRKDPAARSKAEVLLTYPGLHAVWLHRCAHLLWRREQYLLARVIAYWARRWTGIEIHPAATIGRRLFIDHGMGAVIGETAEIGDDVVLFHGVTLGGARPRADRRHPRIGDRVILGAGATILGPVSIGADARVGAGAVVLTDVPAGATAVGVPARLISAQESGTVWEDDPAAWI